MFEAIGKARRRASAGEGFNLAEMLIMMLIFSILLVGVLFFFQYGLLNSKVMQARTTLSQQAAAQMEKMVRQIRVAHRFTVPPTITGVVGNPIDFTGDVLGEVVPGDRTIIFWRSTANVLYSRDNGVDVEMARNVTNLVFKYYDATGTLFTDGTPVGQQITAWNKTLIKKVDIQLTMQSTVEQTGVTVVRNASVEIRSQLN